MQEVLNRFDVQYQRLVSKQFTWKWRHMTADCYSIVHVNENYMKGH